MLLNLSFDFKTEKIVFESQSGDKDAAAVTLIALPLVRQWLGC